MDNKLIFLGLIFIALISFMIFSDDDIEEEVGNSDVLQQEIVADNEENDKKIDQLSPKKNKRPKRRRFVLDENDKKRKTYEKVIFIEVIVIVSLILVIVILWIFFSFFEEKMAKDREEMDKTILYYLENNKVKVDPQKPGDGKDDDSSDDSSDSSKNIINIEEERQKKMQEEVERKQKMIEDQKKLEETSFQANVSLTLKPKEDRIIVFHYNENVKEDYDDYKKGKEAKAKEIAVFFKKSFQLEQDFYSKLALTDKDNKKVLNSLASFIGGFLSEEDSDSFLEAVANEILSTLKILSLKGYDENNALKAAAPITYNFLGEFQPDPNVGNVDNNINNKVNNKQLVFNGYEFRLNDEGAEVINNETSIDTDNVLYAYKDNEKFILPSDSNDEIWSLIANFEYKKYISLALDRMQQHGNQKQKIILLPDSEICPFKVLLHLLHIARFVVSEIADSIKNGEVDNKIMLSAMNIKKLQNNYNQYFEN